MSLTAAAPAYKPGDLSRLLAPSAGAPPVLAAAAASDPTLFGYLRPTKGRPPSRKSAKGGGKFSKQTLAKKASIKKQEAKKQQERHKQEVAEAAARKAAIKEAKSASGRPKVAPAASSAAAAAADEDADDAAEEDGQSEGSGVDESDGDEADDVDEAAIEEFMKDIEADGDDAAEEDGSDAEDAEDEDPEAKAKRERIAKREKRLAEDEQMEAPLPRKKDLKRAREEARTNDPRLPRTIFVGNVPTALKAKKLGHWVEEQLGVDSAVSQSIIESVRYRSVAVADPKIPKRVAVQKGLFHEARDSLNAYVVFTEAAGETFVARAVKELTGKDIELDGKKWRIRVDRVGGGAEGAAAAASEGGAEAAKKDDAHSVFVGNLPFSVNENDLYAHFDSCGTLLGVRVVRDRDSQLGKGIAFLRFGDAQSVRNALAFHGTKFGAGERTLRVMRAVENKKLHQAADTGASSKKKGGAAGSASATGSNKKAGGAGSNKKEGYGGTHKVKEVNRAGVLKKPRHKPRDGTAAVLQPVGRAPEAAGAAAAAGGAAARPTPPVAGKKRAFEGEHADPTTVVKRARVEQVKKMERKEKKRDNKKL
jgi:nucleolar protein 12